METVLESSILTDKVKENIAFDDNHIIDLDQIENSGSSFSSMHMDKAHSANV